MKRVIIIAALLASACGARQKVRVITSTEVAGTGLPQLFVRRFSAESEVPVDLQIIDAAALRTRDLHKKPVIVLTNDAALIARLEPAARLHATFARDDYVILGPKSDPADVRDAGNAPEAFRRIVAHDSAFCSAVDIPRFRARESEIWLAANVDRFADHRYRPCHGDTAQLLRDIASRNGYALVDRAALASLGTLHSVVLLENTPLLRNDYVILLTGGRKPERNADWFVQWVMSYRGRDIVEHYRVNGEKRFSVP